MVEFKDIFSKYKTYDPQEEGYGNPQQWKNQFKRRAKLIYSKIEEDLPELETLKKCRNKDQLTDLFRKLVLKYHPDIAGNTEENLRMTQELIRIFNSKRKHL